MTCPVRPSVASLTGCWCLCGCLWMFRLIVCVCVFSPSLLAVHDSDCPSRCHCHRHGLVYFHKRPTPHPTPFSRAIPTQIEHTDLLLGRCSSRRADCGPFPTCLRPEVPRAACGWGCVGSHRSSLVGGDVRRGRRVSAGDPRFGAAFAPTSFPSRALAAPGHCDARTSRPRA